MNPALKIPLCNCDSSQIASHGFDPASNTLVLQFKRAGEKKGERVPGTKYSYSGFSADDYKAFTESDSLGTFFGAKIKGVLNDEGTPKYPFSRLIEEDKESA